MENPVEEIKKRIDIVDFIGSFINLKKTGRNFKAICPFHQEKTPSFIVSPERQIWHCFGACNEGGDVIKFLMKWENITFVEALSELAKKTGVTLKQVNLEDAVWKKKQRIFSLNQLAASFFHYLLMKKEIAKKTREYLKKREINEKIIEKFFLGYAPSSWDSLLRYLIKKGFTYDEISQSGLVITSGKRAYDRFRARLIFPIFDARGQIIGFSGRIIEEENKDEAKYVNTPETLLYHKRESLYGIQLAKDAIKKENQAILVEGEFDMITPYSNGIENIVATKGAAVTREQLMLLKRFTNRLILSLDADLAGLEAMKKAIAEAEGFDIELNVVVLDFAKDPDEAVRKDLPQFKKLLKKPQPIYDFIIDLSKRKHEEDSAFAKKQIIEEVAPIIDGISNPIIRDFYVKKLSGLVDLSKKAIEQYFYQRRVEEKQKKIYKKIISTEKKVLREVVLEKFLLSYIFQEKDKKIFLDKITNFLSEDDFYIPTHGKILLALINYYQDKEEINEREFSAKDFISYLDNTLIPTFDEIYLYLDYDKKNDLAINRVIYEIKKYSLKRKITNLLKEEDSQEKEAKIRELNQKLAEIEKKMIKLNP
jgi:DNA primase